MDNSKLPKYMDGIVRAEKRKHDVKLADALTLELVRVGLCSSYHQTSWRIVTLPECLLEVQLEFTNDHVDVIPLSAHAKSLNESFPLASYNLPHHVRLALTSNEDIVHIVSTLSNYFPHEHVEKGKATKRRTTTQKAS